ncbi:MAG: uroporphyrinogen decarboxylase family protein [Planctomycetota bacterium]
MTSRERLLTVLRGGIPDCVPVMPDFSNMIPARLTGKPFWDLYLYRDPPLWEAYIACAKHFDVDSLMDGYFPLVFPDEQPPGPQWEPFIVYRSAERIVTQRSYLDGGKRVWEPTVVVYYVADPPTPGVKPEKIGLPPQPQSWEPVVGAKPVDTSPAVLKRVKALMGAQGLVGIWLAHTCVLGNDEAVFDYYDNPGKYERLAEERVARVEKRFANILKMEVQPDFLAVGGSGTLIFQTVEIFRRIAFPAVKRAIELATASGFPTHIHSCGPEKELVKIMATETNLTVIDPLEQPPMGDCDLAELKRLYGHKIVLKGNLHTTSTMLFGSAQDVVRASRQAIDAAAEGGRFILATGDQCGRDTPDENLRAMVETARTYGRYR